MKLYQIKIISQNKNSIEKLIILIQHLFNDINTNIKFFETKKKKKILTILKSPHVNKKAQEQFEINTFYKKINIFVPRNKQLLILLKLVKTNLFTDTKINIKFINNNRLLLKKTIQVFNPDNYKLNFFNSITNQKKTVKFFFACDIYGELNLLNRLI